MITEKQSGRRTASYTGYGLNIVLISTYELGRQPFGVVSPTAWLRKRGHSVRCLDLTRESLDASAIQAAGLVAIYLPMHTATRLAVKLIPRLHELNQDAHLCCYGLYAPMNADYLRSLGVEAIFGGEFEQVLADLADHLAAPQAAKDGHSVPLVSLERLSFEVPDRSGMPPLTKYAHLLLPGDTFRVVGSTEASRGCKHLCRHCPIVPVYKGKFRIVNREVVMEDVRRQIAAGARHISFGDPDFFNGIRHSLELMEQFHREFPGVTYDATIKIEHLRKYERHLPALKETGCLFIISAVESVDDSVLRALEKGHTREDFLQVIRLFRDLGLTLHPTFVPFSQWTTMESYLDLLEVLHVEGLIESVAPVQLGIRMLIPEGSRLLELEEVRRGIGTFDPESLFYPWKHADARVDALCEAVQAVAAVGERNKESRTAIFERIWKLAHSAAGLEAPVLASSNSPAVPFLSEPWYCCAEPTREQLVSIGQVGRRVQDSVPAIGSYT